MILLKIILMSTCVLDDFFFFQTLYGGTFYLNVQFHTSYNDFDLHVW